MVPGSASSHPEKGGGVGGVRVGVVSERFRHIASLGTGAMGSVGLAEDTELHRRVAIKTVKAELSRDPEFRKRIERECLLHAKAGPHPHIVTLFDRFEAEGQIHLVMEYVEGESLQAMLQRNADQAVVLPLREGLQIGAQCLEALSRIHAQGIVHRDIKPSNIMISHDESGAVCAKLMDFGVARLTSDDEQLSRLTTTDSGGPGTPLYMAPEQIDSKTFGEISAATDVYAMGILLYQLFSGSPPFRGTLTEVLNAHVNVPAPRLDKVAKGKIPSGIADALQKALAKRPKDRYASAKAFHDELVRVATLLPDTLVDLSGARTVPLVEPSPSTTRAGKGVAADAYLTGTTVIRMLVRRKRNLVTLIVGLAVFVLMAAATLSWLRSALRGDSGDTVARQSVSGPEGTQVAPPSGMVLPPSPGATPDAPAVSVAPPAPGSRERAIEPAPQWYIRLVRMDWKHDWDNVVVAPEFVSDDLMGGSIIAPVGDEASSELGVVAQPGPASQDTLTLLGGETAGALSEREYVVQPGDSLSKIAAKYGLNAGDLQWWNGIRSPRSLSVGQTILLYQPEGIPSRAEFFAQIAAPPPSTQPQPVEAAPPPQSAEDAFKGPADAAPVDDKSAKPKRTLKDVWRKIRGK